MAIFIRKNIRYSEFDRTKRVRGDVVISFVVKRDGSLDNIQIVKSLLPEIDKECLRVVAAMPLWRPAISGGRPVEITHTLPLTIAF
ncbi:MAG: TonB family protein [Bacteroidales bacterium]|nr:TonB family protein [Bacteroidales bacterium]